MEKYVYLISADNDSIWPDDWLSWNVCVTLTREQAELEIAKRYPLAVRSRKPPAEYCRPTSFDKADDPVLVDVFEDSFAHRGLDRAVRIFVERWPVKVETGGRGGKENDSRVYVSYPGAYDELKALVHDILSEMRCRRSCADCPHERDEGCEFMDRATGLGVFDEPA